MPGFVQIMEFETSRIDEVEALSERMRQERGDALLASKATITEDRDRPGHYLIMVEFDSYEEAMKNSDDPATSKYADEMGAMLAGPPTFRNLDVRSIMNVRE
jgi:quinol monooxygenase YgiN